MHLLHTNYYNNYYYSVVFGSYILHIQQNLIYTAQCPFCPDSTQCLLCLSVSPDAVTPADLQRVGERMAECPMSLAAMGGLANVPGKREVEEALREHSGRLATKKRLFSFR